MSGPIFTCYIHVIQANGKAKEHAFHILPTQATFADARRDLSGSVFHPDLQWNFFIPGRRGGLLPKELEGKLGPLLSFYQKEVEKEKGFLYSHVQIYIRLVNLRAAL